MNQENNIQELFRKAREEKPKVSFQETKETFLKSLDLEKSNFKNSKKGKVFTLKSIIMSTLISISLIFTVFYFSENSAKNNHLIQNRKTENKTTIPVKIDSTLIKKVERNTVPQYHENKSQNVTNETVNFPIEVESIPIQNQNKILEDTLRNEPKETAKILEEPYLFPKLTEEEIQKTKKQKKKMLKALAKFDNDYYSFIPSGSFDYKGDIVSVQGFYMQRNEVSNLEYRTFLFDLLIKGQKEAFLIAKPEQKAWEIALGDSAKYMVDNYFSNEIYNDYPVNNISRKAAELYCNWLNDELKAYASEKELMHRGNIRLPLRTEWTRAATAHGAHSDFAFEGELYRENLNYYSANFNLNQYSGKIKEGFELHTKEKIFPSSQTFKEKKPVYTWNYKVIKNFYGVYNLSGNVAEMVYDYSIPIQELKDNKKFHWINGTAGGGWMNSAEDIKINAQDPHLNETKPHPNIGFRVIISYLRKPYVK